MKDFIPFKESLELKQLGFDERCLGKFVKHYNQIERILNSDDFDNWWTENSEDLNVPSPMFSQAFRWFREKYGLWQIVMQNTDKDWTYDILPIIGMVDYEIFDVFETYEEAELECLKKLIEIVKQKQ